MAAYYNEHDPFAAAWLRELIRAGHIAPGEVDERSIEDVLPSELRGFTQCHFFAGIGVWSYALRQAGWPDDREVWTGSCPCQPFSAAGKRGGVADERHLWPAFYHLIRECSSEYKFSHDQFSLARNRVLQMADRKSVIFFIPWIPAFAGMTEGQSEHVDAPKGVRLLCLR